MIKKTLKNIASKLGVNLVSQYDKLREEKYLNIIEKISQNKNIQLQEGCSIIIFSKDRAMQLDALLRSYYHYTKNPVSLHILYQASSEEYNEGYQRLKQEYNNHNVHFTIEKNFKNDLLKSFDDVNTSRVLFLVDDIFFKSSFDMESFASIDPKKYVASLRMGGHLNFCYTTQKPQELPIFIDANIHLGMLSWSYRQGKYDWAYPLSVDGHLFDTNEFKVMINELDYKAPNSFEESLQLMLPLFSKRKGLCYEKSVIINNPCNKVQEENDNIFGAISIEELNSKWLNGFRINFEKHDGITNKSAHQELALDFIKR